MVNCVLFLQETHSNRKVEQKLKKDFKGHAFFSHGTTISCGVLTAYFGKETFIVKKQETDKEGCILILDVFVNDYISEYILINLYNANTEKEQINVFSNMFVLLEKFDINKKSQIIIAGDFNLLFDSKLDVQGENPTIKKKSLSKLIELIRNTKSRWFTITQKHSLGFIQRKLDYIFIPNTLQELVTTTQILTPISTDYSHVLLSLSEGKDFLIGKGFWKFDNSLSKDQNYITKIKKLIRGFCATNESLFRSQLRLELLKYEVRKFTINYMKQIAKKNSNNDKI